MALDPTIVSVFGEPPAGLDLEESIVVGYNVAVCVVLGLAAASVALRFYVRSIKGAKLWWDDYTILLSVVSACLTVSGNRHTSKLTENVFRFQLLCGAPVVNTILGT